jgi:transposase
VSPIQLSAAKRSKLTAPDFERLARNPCPNRLSGVLGHELLELSLGTLVIEMSVAGPPEHAIRELERLLGRKTLEVEILKEALAKAQAKKPSLQLVSPLRDAIR